MSYKNIIRNMIETNVKSFIEKRIDRIATIEGTLTTPDNRDINFTTTVIVSFHDYEIHGYMDEYGDVEITSIHFDRIIRKDMNSNPRNVHTIVYGDRLKTFAFDR